MSRRRRPALVSVLIACEGTVTEYAYFERLKEEIEELGNFAITVYPDREEQNPKTTALQLVKVAKDRSADYDEVWVVFDKDGYSKHEEAVELANSAGGGKQVNIAFSSIAFEEWVLSHFERNPTPFPKSECREGKEHFGCGSGVDGRDCLGKNCLCGRLRQQNYLSDYGKSSGYDLFPKIRNRMDQAFINAAWLRALHQGTTEPLHGRNPYTDVDLLVRRLFNFDEQICWIRPKETLNLGNLQIGFESINGAVRLSVRNLRQTSIVLNELKFSQFFDMANEYPIRVENRQMLPDEKVVLDFELIDKGGARPMLCLRTNSWMVFFDHSDPKAN